LIAKSFYPKQRKQEENKSKIIIERIILEKIYNASCKKSRNRSRCHVGSRNEGTQK